MKFCCSLAFNDPSHFVELAKTAEDCGWDALMLSDHVVHPEKIRSTYPYTKDGAPRWEAPAPWPDPWVAIGAMAAVTSRIRFMTAVYVLPLRNPFVVAKAVGTAAVMSGNRVTLGIGAGFHYVEGSARFDDVATEPTVVGRELLWSNLLLLSSEQHTIKLLLAVGAGVSEGEFTNQAQAVSALTGNVMSATATATVRLVPDPT